MATEEQRAEKDADLDRLIFLSDGVFAIAITLLILELIPDLSTNPSLSSVLSGLAGKTPTYVISFILISVYWITHQNMFRYIKRSNNVLIWLNIFYLMSIAFLPISNIVLGSYPGQRAAVIFYTGSLTITAILIILIWWYASSGHRLVDKQLDPLLIKEHRERSLIAPIIFLLSIGVAFLQPFIAEFIWLLVAPIILIHNRVYRRRMIAR